MEAWFISFYDMHKNTMINLKELTCTKPLKKVLEPLAYCIVAFITEAYNNYTLDLNDLQP